jgi:threonine aldolase
MMGGVLRKPGVVAGPGIVALKTMPQTLAKDNLMARELAKKMTELGWIEIVIPVETNIIFFKFTV